jgi:F-type H+-transporting ATPase subunit delta
MSAGAIANRYARALFELAEEFGQTAQYAEQFKQFSQAYLESKALREIVASPVYSKAQKLQVVQAIAKKLGMSDTAQNGIKQLLVRGRLAQLSAISSRLGELSDDKANILRASLTTAAEANSEVVAKIKAGLAAATGKNIEIEARIDASLVGGAIVEVAGVTVDASVRGRLENLERGLNDAASRLSA